MKKLLLLSCIFISGCFVQSLNKFYTDDMKVDLPQIEGTWDSTIQMGEDVAGKKISPWKFSKDKVESYDVDGIYSELSVVYFKIGDDLFVDFTAGEPTKDKKPIANFFWMAGITLTHSLCKITFKDDTMVVIPMSLEWFIKKIEDKQMPLGYVKVESISKHVFTASTEEWISFLKAHASDKDVFSEKIQYVFKKHIKAGNEDSTPSEPQKIIIPSRTITATCADIVKYDAKYFFYKKKCSGCGWISDDMTGSAISQNSGTLGNEFTCPKCGKVQKFKIVISDKLD